METYKGKSADTSLGRINRGDVCNNSGYYYPVSNLGNFASTTFSYADLGGRVQLYIK